MMTPLSTYAVELLAEYPELVVAVAIVARLGRAWQRSLSWPEYRAAHRLKRGVFPIVDRLAPARLLLVTQKGDRSDPEYQRTVDAPVKEVVQVLRRGGGSPHLINALKRRPDTHGDPLTDAHVVWTHTDGTQTEAYLFDNDDGSTDVYAHHETSTDNAVGHLTDPQRDGDPRDVVADALGGRGIIQS